MNVIQKFVNCWTSFKRYPTQL